MARRAEQEDGAGELPRARPGITYEVVLHRPEDLAAVAAWAAGIGVEVLFGRGTRLRVRTTLAHVRALSELSAVALVIAWLTPRLREDLARRHAPTDLARLLDA
jgi:hypothetical protein